MEKLALASAIGPGPNFAGAPAVSARRRPSFFVASSQRERLAGVRNRRFVVLAAKSSRIESVSSKKIFTNVTERLKFQGFASISSSSTGQVSTGTGTGTGTAPPVPPPPSYIGSPLFWVGIGVGFSALFSVVVTKVKNYAMQQALKTMMNQAAQSSGPPYTNPAFGSPQFSFPFPVPPQAGAPTPSPSSFASPAQPKPSSPVTVDVSSSSVKQPEKSTDDEKKKEDQKKFSFVDVSPEEKKAEIPPPPEDKRESVEPEVMGSTNGSTFNYTGADSSQQYQSQSGGGAPFLSIEQFEKMMEEPEVQKMFFPYLPEDMRDPTTFKWMMQNPQNRKQLQDMLNNMGAVMDSKLRDSLKNFDLNSPEVKKQFDQIGMTPEEVISKIMENRDVAEAFQNPRVQAAIIDCSQNPDNISKYQNDKEVMDVFTKIAELFPDAR